MKSDNSNLGLFLAPDLFATDDTSSCSRPDKSRIKNGDFQGNSFLN